METPKRNPTKKPTIISQSQKQALIDNLQLEITERARKLRAQYTLQAQGLRTRVELRVNRIPPSLRRARMGDLLQKHTEPQKKDQEPKPAVKHAGRAAVSKPLPKPPTAVEIKVSPPSYPTRTRGLKRTSDAISADKENEPLPSTNSSSDPIPNPKKRTKTAATGIATSSTRHITDPSTILSPKSSNSRCLPHSPIRSALSRPQSPYKSMMPPPPPKQSASPAKAAALAAATSSLASLVGEKLKPTRSAAAAGGRGKATKIPVGGGEVKVPVTRARRGAAAAVAPMPTTIAGNRAPSSASNVSGASTGTTVTKRGGRVAAMADGAKKAIGISAAGRKVAAAVRMEAPAAGRRVLRKRN